MKNSWCIVEVKRGHPFECTEEILKTSRTSFGKKGYSFKTEVPCEEHEGSAWFGPNFSYSCPDCKVETTVYTEEDHLNSAIDLASNYYYLRPDTERWVVDGDTLEIVAAFRMNVERVK